MITSDEFKKKWRSFLIEGYYGLDVNDQFVINYLDCEFENEIKINPNFQYRQIKVKFESCRIYAASSKVKEWETYIDKIINTKT